MAMFSLIEPPELFIEAVLGFHGDGNDCRWLSLTASLQYQIGSTTVAVVPGGFDQESPGVYVTGFGNRSSPLTIPRGSFGRDEAKISHQRFRGTEAAHIIDFAKKREGSQCFDATKTAEGFDVDAIGMGVSEAFEFGIKSLTLGLEILEMFELGRQGGLEGPFEIEAEFGEPLTVFFRPCGYSVTVDEAMIAEHTADTKFGCFAVNLISGSQSQKPAECLLILGGDMDGSKVATPIEPSKHDGIETIGFAAIPWLTGNQRWGDHIAVESVFRENAMQDESGTGGFITSPHGTFLGQAAKEATDFHEVAGELDDLGVFRIPIEDSSSDRFKVYI